VVDDVKPPAVKIPPEKRAAFAERYRAAFNRRMEEAIAALDTTIGLDEGAVERRAVLDTLEPDWWLKLETEVRYMVPTAFQRAAKLPLPPEDHLVRCHYNGNQLVSVLFTCSACYWRGPTTLSCRWPYVHELFHRAEATEKRRLKLVRDE
jgi:hypothetical protein